MSAAPIVNDPPVQQPKISKPKNVRNKSNDRRQQNDWDSSEFNRFYQIMMCSGTLMLVNLLFIYVPIFIFDVHAMAWNDVLRNLTNSSTDVQCEPLHRSNLTCLVVTGLILLVFGVRLLGIDTIIKELRQIRWKSCMGWICVYILIIIFVFGVMYLMNISPKRVGTFISDTCKNLVFNKDCNDNLIIKLPEAGSLPSSMYYLSYCVLYVTILCNIQHIILATVVLKIKPKNYFKPPVPITPSHA